MMLVPLGPDAERPRLPPVTVALIALNVLAFFLTRPAAGDTVAREEASLERVASWTLEKAGREHAGLAARRRDSPTALAFLLRDADWPGQVRDPADRERLERCREDYRGLRQSHPFYRFGLVPAEPGVARLVTHLFLHADPLHLLFNLVFLWAVGGLLELEWGGGFFAAFYAAAGIAAAMTHVAVNAGSVEPAIGASGAVAGLMGAFAVSHARQPMRLALVTFAAFSPRIHFVTWPAWVFLGLWLLEQAFFALLTAGMAVPIAFGAHLGGFAFGALAGGLLTRTLRRAASGRGRPGDV